MLSGVLELGVVQRCRFSEQESLAVCPELGVELANQRWQELGTWRSGMDFGGV